MNFTNSKGLLRRIRLRLRLTKKADYGYTTISNNSKFIKPIDKLGQLEDIEDELGIDLITLINAMKNGIYVNDSASIVFYPARELRLGYDTHYGKGDELCILKDCNYAGNTKLVSLSNYGKTWSLSKNELNCYEENNLSYKL